MNTTTTPIPATTLPTSYTCWADALRAAKKAPEWKDSNPLILCTTHSRTSWTDPPVVAWYEKAYLVQMAAQENSAKGEG